MLTADGAPEQNRNRVKRSKAHWVRGFPLGSLDMDFMGTTHSPQSC